jgi:hypothetical protein
LATANNGVTTFSPSYVAYNPGSANWVICGAQSNANAANTRIYRTSDFTTFTATTSPYAASSSPIGLQVISNTFVILCTNGRFSYSSNGNSWTVPAGNAGFTSGYQVFRPAGSQLIGGTVNAFSYTTNGTSWTSQSSLNSTTGGWNASNFFNLISNGTALLATGGNPYTTYVSTNGTSWTTYTSPAVYVQNTQGSNFIGYNQTTGKQAYSSDGINWTSVGANNPYLVSTSVQASAWDGGNNWVMFENLMGTIGYSTNNQASASALNTGYGFGFYAIAYGLNTFVIIGTDFSTTFFGYVSTSSMGTYVPVTVTRTDTYDLTNYFRIVFGNSRFIAGGSTGKILVSTTGTSWTEYTGLNGMTGWGTQKVVSLAFDGTNFIASGASGGVGISNDGITWIVQPMAQTSTAVASKSILVAASSTAGYLGADYGVAAVSP